MKKIFLNYGLFLVLVLTATVFNSCDKGDDPDSASKITATNVINGSTQIETVKALAYWDGDDWESDDYGYDTIAQAPYQNNGFVLELPATMGAKYLETLELDDDELLEAGISISNKNVKIFFLEYLIGYNVDDDEIGDFYLGEETENSLHYTFWVYVDGDVTIKGEYKDIHDDYGVIEKCDLTLKKGWNIVYGSETENYDNSTGGYVDLYTISNKKPSGVNYAWNFYGYSVWQQKRLKTQNLVFSKWKESRKKR
ncbi:MAG: hypothetical protein LBM67_01520 [Lentimicrobiaceae bacterium]|nr:hypothetical protein [Lentimicrobiaceae bacterium]